MYTSSSLGRSLGARKVPIWRSFRLF